MASKVLTERAREPKCFPSPVQKDINLHPIDVVFSGCCNLSDMLDDIVPNETLIAALVL
jgi:hypothetical protein